MPKKTTGKSTKGTKAPAKKAPAKKAPAKKAPTKNVAAKKAPAKKIEAKKEEVKTMPIEKKGKVKQAWDYTINNTPFAITLCVAIVLFILLIVSACLKVVPKVKDGSEILASLKGKNITAQELYVDLKDKDGTNTLINMIDSYIADKEVKITSADKKHVQEVVDYYKEYAEYYGTDLSSFLASYVGISGVTTEKQFYDYVLADYKKTLAVQKYIGDEASEADLKKYYEENYSDTITAKHILISIDTEAKDQEKAEKEAYDKATKLIKELKKTDKKDLDSKFKTLAEKNSDDTATYSNSGLMENFSKSEVEEAFYNAAKELKNGKFTVEPVKTSYGYHIILKVSSTPVKDYKDIKDEVKNAYAQNLMSQDNTLSIKKWDELRKKYKMSIKDTEVNKAYNETVKNAVANAKAASEQQAQQKAEN